MKKLPNELLSMIFFKIPVQQRMNNVARVSKQFYQIVNDQTMWTAECNARNVPIKEGKTPKEAYIKSLSTLANTAYYVLGNTMAQAYKSVGGKLMPEFMSDDQAIATFPSKENILVFRNKKDAMTCLKWDKIDVIKGILIDVEKESIATRPIFKIHLKMDSEITEKLIEHYKDSQPPIKCFETSKMNVTEMLLVEILEPQMKCNKLIYISEKPSNSRCTIS